jgi:hypothetical protein
MPLSLHPPGKEISLSDGFVSTEVGLGAVAKRKFPIRSITLVIYLAIQSLYKVRNLGF